MPDSFSFSVFGGPLKEELDNISRLQVRATKYALREVGRKVKQAARRAAPVYTGPDQSVAAGQLKSSIRSSKQLRGNAATGWMVRVAPMPTTKGAKRDVILYRRKQEEAVGFMRAALDEVAPQIVDIHARVWGRVMDRGR